MRSAENFIAKGVPTPIVVHMMALLVPQALGQTIPMSLLVGLLVAFGRLSADREFVALQACGVSPARLMRPVALLSALCAAATGYVLLVAVPNGNQTFRELEFGALANYAENEVKPRIFFDGFRGLVLYVRDAPPTGGWNGVFMADNRSPQSSAIYLARAGRVVADRERRTLEMVLDYGTRHTSAPNGRYEVSTFERQVITLDAESALPRGGPPKGDREMSVPELRARAAELMSQGIFPHNQLFEIHKKYSIAFACVIFGLIGLALGATNRRDGSMASFVVGIGVIFAYFVLLWFGQSMVRGQFIPPWLAAWQPNIVLGAAAAALFVWRNRVADQPLQVPVPAFMTRLGDLVQSGSRTRRRRWLPFRTLDRYVARTYLKIFLLAAAALASVFYITTFIDLSEKVFKGAATWSMLGAYFWYTTPQYVYYILPLSALVATLVTVALLTKNSELVAMKACGISLYRVAAPMLLGAMIVAAALFSLDQTVLGPSNRLAETLSNTMRGRPSRIVDVATRRWLAGAAGEIYHFEGFDLPSRQLTGLWVLSPTDDMGRVRRRLFAERATYVAAADETSWRLVHGWVRDFDEKGQPTGYATFDERQETILPAAALTLEAPDPDFMSYSQLEDYTKRLASTGIDVVGQQVALARKLAFPFVAVVMTLIGVPFAVTIGRSGAMAGIGVAIALAIVYWVAISVFGAFGTGGALAPLVAAWAPNVLFGTAAIYMLLTVRT
jgi:LPS export ABC transporter permease LptG/LPS export ABC transporter permease LptF